MTTQHTNTSNGVQNNLDFSDHLISHKASLWVCSIQRFHKASVAELSNCQTREKLAKICKKICRLVTKGARITCIGNYKHNV